MDLLQDVRRDVARFVGQAGECADSDAVVTAINDARRILYPLGDWKGTVEPVIVQCQAGYFTLPARYDYIKSVNSCGGANIQVHNEWYEVADDFDMPGGSPLRLQTMGDSYVTFRDWPILKGVCNSHACSNSGFYLRVVHEDDRDIGVTLRFDAWSFLDYNVSLTRTLTGPFENIDATPSDPPINRLLMVLKPKTFGRIRIYGYDGTCVMLLGIYEKGEVNPTYRRYATRGFNSRGFIQGKAKKKFSPLESDDQFVDIHTEAMIHALQAITDRETRNLQGFASNLKMATDFLGKEIATPLGTTTIPIKMSEAYKVEGLYEY